MIRIFFLALLLGLFANTAYSQSWITVTDDFSTNKLNWYEGENVNIMNGYYEINSPESSWMVYTKRDLYILDDKTEYKLEATFTHEDGETNNGYGFFWSYDDKEKINYFIITTDGYFKTHTTDWEETEWKEAKAIKQQQSNRLKIERTSDKLNFYINDQLVDSSKPFPLYGRYMGFVCYAKMKYIVDDFSFGQKLKINLPSNLKTGLVKENLGPNVNTAYNEVTPKISVDGKMIFFARKSHPDNLGGEDDATDVWVSTAPDGLHWKRAVNVGAPINTTGVDNIVSVSQDNNAILIATSNDFQLYERSKDGWHDRGLIGLVYENEHEYFEASQSADGKAMLLAIENKQNVYYKKQGSEKDIYVSLKDPKGKWSAPLNLGSKINTAGNEMSPFLSADGRTLYFASDGRPGYGGHDIFMSKRIGNGWTTWTEPVNLGPEINTSAFDAYYTVPASGDYAYMVSSADGYGEADLIRVKIPHEIKPEPVVLVYGAVVNAKTKEPIEAKIFFEDLSTGKEVGEAISNPKTGEYRIALPYGISYGFRAVAPGYLSVNENLELAGNGKDYKELHKDLFLASIEIGQAIQLQNVFFLQGKAELKPESYPELDRLADLLSNNPSIEIELSGHTDNRGDVSANYDLSDNRVKAVINYLVSKKIEKKRMSGKGYGGSKPLYPNDTDEHRGMNRRVEFKIVKK